MRPNEKPLVWLHGEVKTPPFSVEARREAGRLLDRLQQGKKLSLPHSRPMPSIGPRCHELRIVDLNRSWRIIYRMDADAIVIGDVFNKTTVATPPRIIDACKRRFRLYDQLSGEE
ncbi:MAG TPA: type II toxin-antitoxin system RelE/ParE family toxin [Longimicrobium sp.]|nr:type II toxin-antitoxin system RelE/ParE family toxin [Longimicrobium sp.]